MLAVIIATVFRAIAYSGTAALWGLVGWCLLKDYKKDQKELAWTKTEWAKGLHIANEKE